MNRIDLIGRLTRDPELRKTETGHVRADFNIAVNRIGAKEEEGNIRNDAYTDKEGNTKYTWYVLASRIEYLSKGEQKESKEELTEDISGSIKMDEIEITDEDLPF